MSKIKLSCPKNKSHKCFLVTAHVVQEWVVNQNAEFEEVLDDCLEVTHRPDKDDRFICRTCGTEAKVE
jgi:hypothetical protein